MSIHCDMFLISILFSREFFGIRLSGDEDPPAKPVFNIHLEEDPMDDPSIDESIQALFDFSASMIQFRNESIKMIEMRDIRIRDVLRALELRDEMIVPKRSSFLQVGKNPLSQIGKLLKHPTSFGEDINYGPIPIFNVIVEQDDVDDESSFLSQTFRNTSETFSFPPNISLSLQKIIKQQDSEIRLLRSILNEPLVLQPSSFVQSTTEQQEISPNYIPDNPPPYTEFDIQLESSPYVDGKDIPSFLPPSVDLLKYHVNREVDKAKLAFITVELKALSMMAKGLLSSRKN